VEAETLVHTLSDTLAGVKANKLVDTPGDVEAEVLINMLAYSVAEAKALVDTKAEV